MQRNNFPEVMNTFAIFVQRVCNPPPTITSKYVSLALKTGSVLSVV